MTSKKIDDSIPAVLRRRLKELRNDGYNFEFCNVFERAAKALEQPTHEPTSSPVTQTDELAAAALRPGLERAIEILSKSDCYTAHGARDSGLINADISTEHVQAFRDHMIDKLDAAIGVPVTKPATPQEIAKQLADKWIDAMGGPRPQMPPDDTTSAPPVTPRQAKIIANFAHAVLHVLDDWAEENAQTGEVNVEIPADQWKELNRVLDLLGDDPHGVLHDAIGVNDPPASAPPPEPSLVIALTPAEIQSRYDRVKWAEDLIRQLPETHDGRNSWLLNYGRGTVTFPHQMLRQLKANWDSYGAPPIDELCIAKAFDLWRQISGEWQVVPCSDGGVQLEQHRDGFDIEITVSPASALETRRGLDVSHLPMGDPHPIDLALNGRCPMCGEHGVFNERGILKASHVCSTENRRDE